MTSSFRSFRLGSVFVLTLLPFAAFGANRTTPPTASPTSSLANVTITYVNPHQFSESRQAGFGHGYNHGDYLGKLKAYLIHRAKPMLGTGQHLAISITDIDLAGGYEPWRGPQWDQVRFMRDIYPPRIDLAFKLTGSDGQVIRQGTRKLSDLAYLYDLPGTMGNSDSLRHDKALLDHWLRRGPTKW